MSGMLTLAWYNILLLFGLYSLLFAILARLMRLGHVLGVVYALSLLLGFFTREMAFAVLPNISPDLCIIAGASAIVISNFIVDFGVK